MLVAYSEASEDLNRISEFDDRIIQLALGPLAPKLIAFLRNVDLSHPEIPIVFGDSLPVIRQLLEITSRCIDLPVAVKFISESLVKAFESLLLSIDDPVICNKNIRFLPKNHINQTRLFKKPYLIDSCFFYQKAEQVWQETPSDFVFYERYSDRINSKIQQVQKMADVFCKTGLEYMAKHLVNSIADLESHDYFGYRRIEIFKACYILAKKNNFAPAEINGRKVLLNKDCREFSPLIVPFGLLGKESKSVSHTDECPDVGFKALFDHHIAIVFDDINPVVLGEVNGSCYFISD